MASGLYMPDYLSAPLGGQPKKRRRTMKLDVPQIIAGLALVFAVLMFWMAIGDDPLVREPANLRIAAKPVDPPATAPQAVAPPAILPDPDKQTAGAVAVALLSFSPTVPGVPAPALAAASPAATTPTPPMPILSGSIHPRAFRVDLVQPR